jgi:hypothetical protein
MVSNSADSELLEVAQRLARAERTKDIAILKRVSSETITSALALAVRCSPRRSF